MAGFAHSNGSPGGPSSDGPSGDLPRSPRFRLVEDVLTSMPAENAPEAGGGPERELLGLIPAKLLVGADAWRECPATDAEQCQALHASIPLIASLTRIRSSADAALALTGVLELLGRRFHIRLPAGTCVEGGFTFDAPRDAAPDAMGRAIDESLQGIVRASDLQGAMGDRLRARIEPLDPDPRD